MTSTLHSPSAGQERDLIDIARRCGAFVMKGLNREVAQLSMTPEVLAAFAAALTSASKQEGGEPDKVEPDDEEWRVGLYISSADPRKCVRVISEGADEIKQHEAHRDFICWLYVNPIAAPQPPLAGAGEALTESYVQRVPDKCDRIVWRNNYYHLPLNPKPAPLNGGDA